MKITLLIAGAALLLAGTEASAQSRHLGGVGCPNGGYKNGRYCCNLNSPNCGRAATSVGTSSNTSTTKKKSR